MPTPASNLVTRFLTWNDQTIAGPLLNAQMKPCIGILPALLEVVANTITALGLGIFAILAGTTGILCKLVGAKSAGDDLLQSAKISLLGQGQTPGAKKLCIMAGFSFINAASFTIFTQCAKGRKDEQSSSIA